MTVREESVNEVAKGIAREHGKNAAEVESSVKWLFDQVPDDWGDDLKYSHVLGMAIAYLTYDDLTQRDVRFGLTRTDDISRYVGHVRKAVGDVAVDEQFGTDYSQ